MYIKSWGARGSLPVSGEEYMKYGGNTTCVEVRSSAGDVLIIDAGTGIRPLGIKLLEEGITDFNMLFTHAHWDHIMGFPFLKPIYMKRTKINVYGSSCAQKSVEEILKHTMDSPYFPVNFHETSAKIAFHYDCQRTFEIGSLIVKPIMLSHPNGGFGYRIEEDGKSFVFLTDNELGVVHGNGFGAGAYIKFAEGADFLIHDSEYLPEDYKFTKGWGHSVYTEALDLAIKSGAKVFALNHHNMERTDEGVDAMVADCRRIAKEQGADLEVFGLTQSSVIEL